MAEVEIRHTDIEALNQMIAALDGPARVKELLSSIVDAIGAEVGVDDIPVMVTVSRGPTVGEQFAAAFTADEAHTGDTVVVTVSKVGR